MSSTGPTSARPRSTSRLSERGRRYDGSTPHARRLCPGRGPEPEGASASPRAGRPVPLLNRSREVASPADATGMSPSTLSRRERGPGAGALREGRAGHGPASPRPPRSRPGTVAVRRTDRPRPVSTVAVRVKGTRPRTDGLEQAVAYVVARSGCGEAKVRRAVNYAIRGGLAAYKRPARLESRDELPTTSTGKLAACELRKASAQQRPGTSRAPPPSPTSVPAPRRYSPRCARARRAAGLCERSPPTGTGPAWPTRWTTGPRAVVTSRGAHRPAFHRGPSGSR